MSYASLAASAPPMRLPISAAQLRRAAILAIQSTALAMALWGCLALPGLLADTCSVTAHQARITAPR